MPQGPSTKPLTWKRFSFLIGLVLTVALFLWAWRGFSPTQVWQILTKVHGGWLLVAWLAFVGSFCLRAWRQAQSPGPYWMRHVAVFIGFGGNCLLPMNAGEVLRAKVLQRYTQIPLSVGVGSIVTERLLDASVAFTLLLCPLFFPSPGTATSIHSLPLGGLGAIIAGGGLVLYAAACRSEWVLNALGWLLTKLRLTRLKPPTLRIVGGLLKGLDCLRSPQRLAIAVLQSFMVWGLSGITFLATLIAFDLPQPGLPGAYFIQSIQAMAAIIPSSPGHLGAFEAAMRFALEVYRVPGDTAIALTLVLRLLMHGSLIVIGLSYALMLGVSVFRVPQTTED
jgi:glycosyltransferase 2 family protein